MNSIRKPFIIATGIAAMGVASVAFAGLNPGMVEQLNNRGSSQSQSSAPASSPPPSSAPSYSHAPASAPAPRSDPQPNFRNSSPNVGRQAAAPQSQPSAGPRGVAPSAVPHNAQPRANSGQDSDNRSNNNGGKRNGVIGGALLRNFTTENQGGNGGGHHNGGNGNGNHDHGDHDGDHGDHHHPRPPSVVYVLPPYYQDYYWNDTRYYNFNGGWYSPYGNSYMSVGAPYGMFVRSLPGYSSSFYYGDVRYYEYDDTYYTYDRSRGGYVVAPSPYNEDDENYEYDDAVDEDIYVYPAQGQSEQQQADDRYACHRWGVKESGYDPIDDEYDRDRRANYVRAMSACLTGRGYSIK